MKDQSRLALKAMRITNDSLVAILKRAKAKGETKFDIDPVVSSYEAINSTITVIEAMEDGDTDAIQQVKEDLVRQHDDANKVLDDLGVPQDVRDKAAEAIKEQFNTEMAKDEPSNITDNDKVDEAFINPCTHCNDHDVDDSQFSATTSNPNGIMMCINCFGMSVYRESKNVAVIIRRYCDAEACTHKPGVIYNPSVHYTLMRRPLYDRNMAQDVLNQMKPSRKDAEQAIKMMSGPLPGDKDYDPTTQN